MTASAPVERTAQALDQVNVHRWHLAIGAGLAIGIAAAGGGIGQGRAAAALEGIAR